MIKSIYAKTVNDAFVAREIMEEFYGDCDIRIDELGECHITAPASVLANLGGIEDDRKKKSRKV